MWSSCAALPFSPQPTAINRLEEWWSQLPDLRSYLAQSPGIEGSQEATPVIARTAGCGDRSRRKRRGDSDQEPTRTRLGSGRSARSAALCLPCWAGTGDGVSGSERSGALTLGKICSKLRSVRIQSRSPDAACGARSAPGGNTALARTGLCVWLSIGDADAVLRCFSGCLRRRGWDALASHDCARCARQLRRRPLRPLRQSRRRDPSGE